ncbi:MAG: YfiR family protein [Lysobacteraceae bacterium]|nr:MAG: YfiR family protein [Xanthomonadaceae bacterium]
MRFDMHTSSPRHDQGRRRRLGAALAALCLAGAGLLPAAPVAAAAPMAASTERVQAAYLHRFLNYVEWPLAVLAQADTPYVIGVAGDDTVADELARIAAGRSVNNRGVIVKRVLPGDTVNNLHMLFIGGAEHTRLAQWLRMTKGRPVLTVSATEGGLDQGSIINFQTIDGRVRFEVSVDAAEQGGLRLNSRLFSVATNVVKGSR